MNKAMIENLIIDTMEYKGYEIITRAGLIDRHDTHVGLYDKADGEMISEINLSPNNLIDEGVIIRQKNYYIQMIDQWEEQKADKIDEIIEEVEKENTGLVELNPETGLFEEEKEDTRVDMNDIISMHDNFTMSEAIDFLMSKEMADLQLYDARVQRTLEQMKRLINRIKEIEQEIGKLVI